MLFKTSGGGAPSWIVAFLGNPGTKYAFTRHNAGFLAAEALKYKHGFKLNKIKFKAATEVGELGGQRALFMQPQTFMNLSGEAVAPASAFYKIPPERVLVISDDVSLPVGRLRIRKNGSAGGHNGLKNIILQLGGDGFPRVKVGVGGKPHPDYDMADWVLSKFTGEDAKAMDQAVKRCADAVECLLREGADRAMSRFNG